MRYNRQTGGELNIRLAFPPPIPLVRFRSSEGRWNRDTTTMTRPELDKYRASLVEDVEALSTAITTMGRQMADDPGSQRADWVEWRADISAERNRLTHLCGTIQARLAALKGRIRERNIADRPPLSEQGHRARTALLFAIARAAARQDHEALTAALRDLDAMAPGWREPESP
jgi:hypothetical protein